MWKHERLNLLHFPDPEDAETFLNCICGILRTEDEKVMTYLYSQWERACPNGDLLLKLVDFWDVAGSDLGLEVLLLVGLLGQAGLEILGDVDALVDVVGNSLEVVLAHASSGHSWSTNSDTAGCESGLVSWDGILVAGNIDLFQHGFDTGTVEREWSKVHKHHVAVCAVGNEFVVHFFEFEFKGFGVGDDLFLVSLEIWVSCLLEGGGEGSDGVIVWATLVTWEDGEVDGTFEIVEDLLAGLGLDLSDTLAEEDHGTSGASEGFVGGGCHDIGVFEGRGDDTGRDETGDVSHINHKIGTTEIGNLSHAGVVDQTAVGRSTGNDSFWSVHQSIFF